MFSRFQFEVCLSTTNSEYIPQQSSAGWKIFFPWVTSKPNTPMNLENWHIKQATCCTPRGNSVSTSHPGCERSVAVEAEKRDPGRRDLCDYCSVVTFLLKGEGIATTWRLNKHLKLPAAHALNLIAHPSELDKNNTTKKNSKKTTHLKVQKRRTEQKLSEIYGLN